MELSAAVHNAGKELSTVSESWKRRTQLLEEENRETEKILLAKEKHWHYQETEKNKELQGLVGTLDLGASVINFL